MTHYTDHELILRVYDVGGADDSHMTSCAECRARWVAVHERRQSMSSEGDAGSNPLLLRQRRMILNRIREGSRPARLRSAWFPAVVAAMVVAGLLIMQPASRRAKPEAPGMNQEAVPDNWFEDAYAAAQPVEPRAAAAIRGLFAEGPQ